MQKGFLQILLVACCMFSCMGGSGKGKNFPAAAVAQQPATEERAFPFPEIPVTLTAPEARKEFLLLHYWDRFDFSDTVLVNTPEVTEQGFVNFIYLLADHTPDSLAGAAIGRLCSGMEVKEQARTVFMQLFDDYLYNANSPYLNEPLYRIYLQRMAQSPAIDEAWRSSFRFRLALVQRNRVGMQAEDFTYFTPDGRRRTLHATAAGSGMLLLVFYDPECPSCHETLLQLAGSRDLSAAIAQGRVKVLAVYTEGNEEAWRKALPELPSAWQAGSDRGAVKDGLLYDLKAMPSLYLLDGRHKVLLKDAPVGQVLEAVAAK